MADLEKLYVVNRYVWHNWLIKNGDSAPGIWLIFYKEHTGKPSLSYDDAVEEALCFGWIDSIIKRIDDEKYVRKFTPRKEKSRWSALNVKRVKKMINTGKMKPRGLELYNYAAKHGLLPAPDQAIRKELDIPQFINQSLSKNKIAKDTFKSLAPSHKRQYIGWVMDAKKEETRMRRLKEMIQLLSEGKKLGLK
ncbi:MAG: hypothetical protein AMS27_08075 [Bacteroides sp. SM23_62_1]|nr:MAG: hypothetical protein AMS27_08075 [Bacteroides sp. SM23_62_1]